MKGIILIVGALLVISLSACEKYTIKTEVDVEVSFSADVQPIFTSNCIGCHDGTGTNDSGLGLNLTEGNAYASLMANEFVDTTDPASSILVTQLNSSSHSYFSSKSNRSTIYHWIEQGALDN